MLRDPSSGNLGKELELADTAHDQNELDRALQHYTRALEIDAACAAAWAGRAEVRNSMQKWELAISDATRALELDPGDAVSHYQRGNANWGLERWQKAADDCSAAINIKPQFPEALCCRGSCFVQLHRIETAVGNLPRVNRIEEAVGDYTKAIAYRPKYTLALGGRGYAYLILRRWTDSIRDLETALEVCPGYPMAEQLIVHAREGLGQAEAESARMMEELLRSEEGNDGREDVASAETSGKKGKKNKKKKKKNKKTNAENGNAEKDAFNGEAGSDDNSSPQKPNYSSQDPETSLPIAEAADRFQGAAAEAGGENLDPGSGNLQSVTLSGVDLDVETEETSFPTFPGIHHRQGNSWGSSSDHGVRDSLHVDLLRIEATAMVQAAVTIGSAMALGNNHGESVSEDLFLAATMKLENEMKGSLIEQLHQEYLSAYMHSVLVVQGNSSSFRNTKFSC